MQRALEAIAGLKAKAERVRAEGNRDYNPGWHTALDLANLLTVSEAVTRAALERKESRGAHFRDDFEEKSAEFGKVNIVVRAGAGGAMEVRREALPEMPEHLKQVIEEMK